MTQFKRVMFTLAIVASSATAMAKDIQIQENSSGLPADKVENIARTAVAMGAKEPLVLRKSADGVSISGSSATVCNIKLKNEQIQGVSCK
ncbi:MAG: hypothetical protein Q4E16_07000 [Neisseria sp.]|nr:hypothetical protein [Neisseria sp.]